MKLHDVTQRIIHEVEANTGYPVHVSPDEKLATLAVVTMARGPLAMHVIRYKPDAESTVDYMICFQCGFILRQFDNPPDSRFHIDATDTGQVETLRMLTERGGIAHTLGLKPTQATELRDQLYSGLITQLRSIPIGLRVDLWLLNNYPELRDQQRTSVLQQIKDGLQVASAEYERTFPPRIYQSSVVMNIAYAQFWAGIYGEMSLSRTYRTHKFYSNMQFLLKAFDEIPKDATHDRELVDAWAKHLNLEGWYKWVKYEPPI